MPSAERVGKNEAIFREVNERIEEVSVNFLRLEGDWIAGDEHTIDFVCECSRVDCTDQITLTLAVYERVRSNPTHFVLAVGHDDPEFEKVIEQASEYAVVEKIGEAAKVAVEQDPRS